MGRFLLALGIFVAALNAQDDSIHQRVVQALGPRAEVLLQQKRWLDIEPLLAQNGNDWALRGALEFLAGRMEGSVNCFTAARERGELRESDRFTLAMALVRLDRQDKARAELTPLAVSHPANALYQYWLGRLDYDERRYPEAVEKLKKAVALDARSARAWDSLGLAYDMQGRSQDALRAFETGAKINREQPHSSPWPPHDLGVLLLRTGETKRAATSFREALSFDPRMQEAHYHLGRALEKLGANEDAEKEYVRAMDEGRTTPDVCYSLAMLYRKMSRSQDAEAMFAEWRRRRDSRPLQEQ